VDDAAVALLLSRWRSRHRSRRLWSRHIQKSHSVWGNHTGLLLFILQASDRVLHVAHDYVSFIVLIGSLFVVSGAFTSTSRRSNAAGQCHFFVRRAVVANFWHNRRVMLLIRP